ncbi:hypothetical protein ElyMa_004115200, partial [Elysia marginata]
LDVYVAWFRFELPVDPLEWLKLDLQLEFLVQAPQHEAGPTLINTLNEKFTQQGGYSVKPLAVRFRLACLVTYFYREDEVFEKGKLGNHQVYKTFRAERAASLAINLTAGSFLVQAVKIKTLDDCLLSVNQTDYQSTAGSCR